MRPIPPRLKGATQLVLHKATQGNTGQHEATHALSQKQQHSAIAVLTFSQKENIPAKATPHLTEILLAI